MKSMLIMDIKLGFFFCLVRFFDIMMNRIIRDMKNVVITKFNAMYLPAERMLLIIARLIIIENIRDEKE